MFFFAKQKILLADSLGFLGSVGSQTVSPQRDDFYDSIIIWEEKCN